MPMALPFILVKTLPAAPLNKRTRFVPCGYTSSNRPARLPLLSATPLRLALLLAPGSGLFGPPLSLSAASPLLAAACSLSLPPSRGSTPQSSFITSLLNSWAPLPAVFLLPRGLLLAWSFPLPFLLAARVVLLAASSFGVPGRAVSLSFIPLRLAARVLQLAASSCGFSLLPLESLLAASALLLRPFLAARGFSLLPLEPLLAAFSCLCFLSLLPSFSRLVSFASRATSPYLFLAAGVLTVTVRIVLALYPHLVAASVSLPWACRRVYPLRPLF
ncbi:hypothetical protein KSP39_PZI002386 [Platanthera zijinensis]|uniref:Uncharacterized protein n=1 Tax=Platanthera zijinensis TaxID=2320716 RepID=A0AAP0BZ77_9ASPA